MTTRTWLVGIVIALGVGGLAGYALKPAGVDPKAYQQVVAARDALETRLPPLEEALRVTEAQRDALERTLQALQAQVDDLKSEVSVLRGKESDLRAQLESAAADVTLMGQLRAFFNAPSPFEPAPPATLFHLLADGSGLFLQFDPEADPPRLRYLGMMVPGRFCRDANYEVLVARGYVHFRARRAPSEATAAGGRPGEEGYWMRFIALDAFEMPWGLVQPGLDLNHQPTAPPDCPQG